MNVDEQNERNKGSLLLLLGLILVFAIALVIFCIMVSAEESQSALERTETVPLAKGIPEILGGMNRLERTINELEKENERLNRELEETKLVIVEMTNDMLLLSQTIAP